MKDGYQTDMRRIIGRNVTIQEDRRGVTVMLPCSEGHTVEHTIEKRLPPEALKRQLANRGWTLGRHLRCPEHNAPTRAQRETKTMAEPTAAPTAAARRMHRDVMEALMIAYDDDKKAYSAGFTDTKIAEETGAALEYVRKVREDYYGPLAIPPELTGIKQEMDALVGSIALTRRDMAQIRSNGEIRVNELENMAKAIGTRLEAIAKKNGWA